VALALGGFVFWGLAPLYYVLIDHVPTDEILAHRVVWTFVLVIALRAAGGRLYELRLHLSNPRTLGLLTVSALLVGTNWLVFTWAVTHERVLETSLGYFINPLISVALGMLVHRERLRPLQQAAVLIAVVAVLIRLFHFGYLPWVSLTLATTFGVYGLVRKNVGADALGGLLVETLVLIPFGAVYMGYLYSRDALQFLAEPWAMQGYLMLAGPVTTIPLVLFASGVRRINLSTVGVLQYVAPSISFCLAVFALGEPFGTGKLVTFALIWVALAIYTFDALWTQRTLYQARRTAPNRE